REIVGDTVDQGVRSAAERVHLRAGVRFAHRPSICSTPLGCPIIKFCQAGIKGCSHNEIRAA
ncbi:MAG: hypothetical protein ACJ780_00140, partial [Solirubrobacteraceae bacterium]